MNYKLKLQFKDSPRCRICVLCGTKGVDLHGETVMACYGLGMRPRCPEEGCRSDCPLKRESEEEES